MPNETSRRRSPRQFNDLSGTEWIRFTRSWFVHNPPRRTASQIEHPAKFPEGMAEEFIRFFTRHGETVLDPFAGVGSTLVACQRCERSGVGIEISPEFAALAAERVGEDASQRLICGDARDAAALARAHPGASVQFVLTSPPYWDMLGHSRGGVESVHKKRRSRGLRTVYTRDGRDLGNIAAYDDFIGELVDIFVAIGGVLDAGRYMVVVCQNVRTPQGVVQPLAWDLARALAAHFQFKGERIWVQDNKPLGIWGYPSEFVTNVHHHYCLVFKNLPPVATGGAEPNACQSGGRA